MKTLLDKIWDRHLVKQIEGGTGQLYADRLYCHEVTTPQAFEGMRKRGLKCFRPEKIICIPDHNISTTDKPMTDPVSIRQVDALVDNAAQFGLRCFAPGTHDNGIIHVVGPEKGLSLPGMTIVCGDSHTTTHGAVGALAFGIGTSEVEMVLASQCVLMKKPLEMRITLTGKPAPFVTAKDISLALLEKYSTSGATGYFVEYDGEAVRSMPMAGRFTICNMSIEMGARGALIAPDDITFEYLKGSEEAPKGEEWDRAVEQWRRLKTDEGAVFDKEYTFDVSTIKPRISYGTTPAMNMEIGGTIGKTPAKSLEYMGFKEGDRLEGMPIQYVFLGTCTNGRADDFRDFASVVKGHRKHPSVTAWIVPGSWKVHDEIYADGTARIIEEAGFEIRRPGCSACLAMNDDKIPAGKYCVSTSNRNFEGRQGKGSRTLLASPFVAAAAAITGCVTNPADIKKGE